MEDHMTEDETTFYVKAEQYWKDIPPTVDGMLGGYGSISSIDINGSKKFLQKFLGVRAHCFYALECFLCKPAELYVNVCDYLTLFETNCL